MSRRLGFVVIAFALAPGFALAAAGDPQYKPVAKDLRWAKAGSYTKETSRRSFVRTPGAT